MENDNVEKVEEKHDETDVRKVSEENKTLEDDAMQKEGGISEPKSAEPKKRHNALAIVFAFLMLVCAGVAIFFGIKYFEPKAEPEPVTVEKIEKEVKVEIVKETMADDYKEVEDVVNNVTAGIKNDFNYIVKNEYLMYKPEGLNTYVPVKFTMGKRVHVYDTDDVETNINLLKTKLENEGFSSIGLLPNGGSAPTPNQYGYLNSSLNVVCGVTEGNEWTSPNHGYDYAFLNCAKTDWVWLTEVDKTLISELEVAYREKEGEYPTVLIVGGREIKDSQYAPYQTITVGVKGAAGLFYRTSPEAKWQFFTGTQAVLDCSDYDTEDLKKAYLGEPCYNYNTQTDSTVQL